jgi:hypothetical protein
MISHQIGKGALRILMPVAFLFVSTQAFAEETEKTPPNPAAGIGTDPSMPTTSGSNSTTGHPPMTLRTSTENWEFGFHGYMRAPLLFSFDNYPVKRYQYDADGDTIMTDDGVPDLKDTGDRDWRFNMPIATPDNSYSAWAYTKNMPGPWAEMLFSYGNQIATANVTVAAWNLTDSGYRNFNAQLGINQAWLTLKFLRAFGKLGGLKCNAGVFDNRYGQAGRYEAGRYDTYIIGRTHTAGETLTANFDFTNKITLFLEHGFGAKTEVLEGDAKYQIDSMWQPGDSTLNWVPYAGQGQMPAFVNHGHIGLLIHDTSLWDEFWLNFHVMHSFTNSADASDSDSAANVAREQDGKYLVLGGEVKFNGAVFGDTYLGFSTVQTDGLFRMPDSIEILHSLGGWNFLKNFYGDMLLGVRDDGTPGGDASRDSTPNPGTGRVNTVEWQYTFSLAKLIWYLHSKRFYGQGPDLTLAFFGMYNRVRPDKDLEPYLRRWSPKKLKLGGEAFWTPLKYFGMGFRVDRVIPDFNYDSDDPTNDQVLTTYCPFTVLTPMIRIKTAFLTHEELNVSYARYLWDGDRNEVRAENPHENVQADRNAVMISVNMWW